jgi:hypothetical protein
MTNIKQCCCYYYLRVYGRFQNNNHIVAKLQNVTITFRISSTPSIPWIRFIMKMVALAACIATATSQRLRYQHSYAEWPIDPLLIHHHALHFHRSSCPQRISYRIPPSVCSHHSFFNYFLAGWTAWLTNNNEQLVATIN